MAAPKEIWVIEDSDGCIWAENDSGVFFGTNKEAEDFARDFLPFRIVPYKFHKYTLTQTNKKGR